MNNNRADLGERFSCLEDEDLVRRFQSGDLTELAQDVALMEIKRRQLPVPAMRENPDNEQTFAGRDLFMVATYFDATKAHIIHACLVAEGVPAVIADANMVQTYSLITSALGGARILVPEMYVRQAQEIIVAFERGDFQLDDDADVGKSE